MKSKILLCALALCLLASGTAPAFAEALDLSALGDIEEAQMVEMEAPKAWTYPIPYELLTGSDYLTLVNRDNLLAEDYVPQDLVKDVKCRKISYDPIQLREVAAQALYDMFKAAEADGVYLYAHSGYRSYRTQKTLYYNRLDRLGKDDGVVQYPGASEHQSGLTIDIVHKQGIGKKFTNAFAKTKEGKWVAEHCTEYGFVIRYAEDKREITGIAPESWHLRYVGVQVAQYMTENNLCLEEFTQEWKEAAAAYEAAE